MPQQPPFAKGQINTSLPLLQEMEFRKWLKTNGVPFNIEAPVTDYDMRGYWQGLQQGHPMAAPTEVNANDGRPHFTDYYKTPLHQSFSAGSQFAGADAPEWINGHQLAAPNGRILFDERPSPAMGDLLGMK